MQYTFWTWTHKIQFAGQIFVSSQGVSISKFVKEDPHFWWHEKTRSRRIENCWDSMGKGPPPWMRIFAGSWGSPQTWSWAKSTPLVDPQKKAPQWDWSICLPTWMDEIYGTCRWKITPYIWEIQVESLHTQLHFDLKRSSKGIDLGSIWENCHVEMYTSCELPINLTEKVWMYTPPPPEKKLTTRYQTWFQKHIEQLSREILLMDKIPNNHLAGRVLVNNGIIIILGGAGFLNHQQ